MMPKMAKSPRRSQPARKISRGLEIGGRSRGSRRTSRWSRGHHDTAHMREARSNETWETIHTSIAAASVRPDFTPRRPATPPPNCRLRGPSAFSRASRSAPASLWSAARPRQQTEWNNRRRLRRGWFVGRGVLSRYPPADDPRRGRPVWLISAPRCFWRQNWRHHVGTARSANL